ncbi:acyl-CoA dehydrogenase family protein [Acrocarpospora catenulata]|uniref:acyl-CoA dehydrogenase family protein n=1 Tax=Acrocarpospora catenulata TaxID=2836182 RepID=UPI001BDB1774|nr:acyl-CoA dehydrogenase family protein [Acrocarpospora catenulata]
MSDTIASPLQLDELVDRLFGTFDPSAQPSADHVRELGSHGWAAPTVPVAYGGRGVGLRSACELAAELSRVDPSLGMAAGAQLLAATLVQELGTDEQKRELLPAIADGSLVASVAITEPQAGTDIAGISTTLLRTADGLRLDGTKAMVNNAGLADRYFVVAKVEEEPAGEDRRPGFAVVVVSPSADGVTIGSGERMMGFEGCSVAGLQLAGVQVDPADVLGADLTRSALPHLMRSLVFTRCWTAGMGVGVAAEALDRALLHAESRTVGGQPLARMQGIAFKLADMAVQVEAARRLTIWAAETCDPGSGATTGERAYASSLAKLRATDAAMAVTIEAVQVLGGWGYFESGGVARLMRAAKALQIFEGANEVHRSIISRNLYPVSPRVAARVPDTSQQAT